MSHLNPKQTEALILFNNYLKYVYKTSIGDMGVGVDYILFYMSLHYTIPEIYDVIIWDVRERNLRGNKTLIYNIPGVVILN